MNTANVELRDYLRPGGIHPYDSLVPHLEAHLKAGRTVYLWSVAGHFVLAGHPSIDRPWSDGTLWYKSAQDCLDRRNGEE